MHRYLRALLGLALLAIVIGPMALDASAGGRNPGSLLVYPYYNSEPGGGTIISLTNISHDKSGCAHFVYIDGKQWSEFNRFECLTPSDEFSVLADWHNPNSEVGFLYVVALNPSTGAPFDFNCFIGDAIIVDGRGNFVFGIEAIAFNALTGAGTDTDVSPANGMADLNGAEYEFPPEVVDISSFIGQGVGIVSNLILVALTSSSDFETRTRLAVWNNNEKEFSARLNFRCWVNIELARIDGVFNDSFLRTTITDPNAPPLPWQTGWARIEGIEAVDVVGNEPKIINPAVIGAFVQRTGPFAAGHLLHEEGQNTTQGWLSH
jgi:hypothetical protein